MGRKLPQEKITLIKSLREQGLTYTQIKRETGVSISKIAEVCRSIGREGLEGRVESLEDLVKSLTAKLRELSEAVGVMEGRLEALKAFIEGYPLPHTREAFTCPECGGRGMYAVKIKCTECGREVWFGFQKEAGGIQL